MLRYWRLFLDVSDIDFYFSGFIFRQITVLFRESNTSEKVVIVEKEL